MSEPLLSICIMSYDRPLELERCIRSIPYIDGAIEIVVRDDFSPKREEIIDMCNNLKRDDLQLAVANCNGGFDINFFEVIRLARGKFVMLCTDDDYFEVDGIKNLLDYLKDCTSGLILCPYFEVKEGLIMRDAGRVNRGKSRNRFNGKQLFDLILISGLIFRKERIPDYELSLVDGSIYSQVFLSLVVGSLSGFSYFDEVVVVCAEDGENGFVNSEDPKKRNRKHFLSNIGFHYGLIKAVKAAEGFLNVDGRIFDTFAREYSLRTFTGLMIAARHGRKATIEYWLHVRKLPLKLNSVAYFIFVFILIFGYGISKVLHANGKKFLSLIRQ